MLIYITETATDRNIKDAAEDLDGYIKYVVDVENKVLTIGGLRHFDGEQLLLEEGSDQHNLWGGGYDLESEMVDYDSIINIRPKDDNPSKEVLSKDIREKIDKILEEKLHWKI
jgi:hypothetical protein